MRARTVVRVLDSIRESTVRADGCLRWIDTPSDNGGVEDASYDGSEVVSDLLSSSNLVAMT
jgi:hypothetical protein